MEIMKLFFTKDEDLYDKKIEDFFDEEVYGLLYTDYWNYWYYSKVVIIALFIFCVLSFVYTLGSGYKDKDNGYKEIKPS